MSIYRYCYRDLSRRVNFELNAVLSNSTWLKLISDSYICDSFQFYCFPSLVMVNCLASVSVCDLNNPRKRKVLIHFLPCKYHKLIIGKMRLEIGKRRFWRHKIMIKTHVLLNLQNLAHSLTWMRYDHTCDIIQISWTGAPRLPVLYTLDDWSILTVLFCFYHFQ